MIKVPQIHPAYENARGSESMPIPIKRAVALKSCISRSEASKAERDAAYGLAKSALSNHDRGGFCGTGLMP